MVIQKIQRDNAGEFVCSVTLRQLVVYRTAHVGDSPAAVKGLPPVLHLNEKIPFLPLFAIDVIRQLLVLRRNAQLFGVKQLQVDNLSDRLRQKKR